VPVLDEIRDMPLFVWAAFLTLLIIAPTTGNVAAIILLVIASVACPYIVFRPTANDAISWILRNDFASIGIGLVNLALLVFSLAWRNAAVIVLLGVALVASSTALFSIRS
jgi:hypothetical protein